MERYELIAPCHFGLEAVLKKEVVDLGYEVTEVENGRVTFIGDAEAICRANIFLRTAERVLLKVGSFKAVTFDELFEATRAIPWEKYLPKDGKCWVKKASSISSKLFSPSDIQKIMKKAIARHMQEYYDLDRMPETGNEYPLRVFFYKDQVTVGIDTSGESLHKRGYRQMTSKAPITETLAAALILLTPWKSGPDSGRSVLRKRYFPNRGGDDRGKYGTGHEPFLPVGGAGQHLIPKKCWYDAIDEATEMVDDTVKVDIQGYDIDGEVIKAARENAERAGVDHMIHFQERPVAQLSHPKKYGFIITNPPYGERIEEKKNLPALYKTIGERFKALDSWSMYLITAYEDAERYIGRKADKNRKIYNGMMKTYYYQFMGPKPPRRKTGDQVEA